MSSNILITSNWDTKIKIQSWVFDNLFLVTRNEGQRLNSSPISYKNTWEMALSWVEHTTVYHRRSAKFHSDLNILLELEQAFGWLCKTQLSYLIGNYPATLSCYSVNCIMCFKHTFLWFLIQLRSVNIESLIRSPNVWVLILMLDKGICESKTDTISTVVKIRTQWRRKVSKC